MGRTNNRKRKTRGRDPTGLEQGLFEMVSAKFWNSKGEEVETIEEAEK